MKHDVIVPQKPNKSKLSVGMGNNHRRNKMFNHKIKKILFGENTESDFLLIEFFRITYFHQTIFF